MKYFLYMLAFVMCCINCVAQIYIEPVFDRADYPEYLHINKIEVTKDTTFVYCTYTAEAGSWARISKETYLYNYETQEKFLLLQSRDLPFSPQKREFPNGGTYQILFSFSGIGNATKLNFIEDPNDEAFNIYGIDLTNTFDTSYSGTDLKCISDQSLSFDTAGDAIKAIQYKEEEKKATAFIYGTKSEQFLMVVYDLCDMYEKYGSCQKAKDEKKKVLDYIDALEDNLEKWYLFSSLSNVFSNRNDFKKALEYRNKAVEIGKMTFSEEHPKYATSLHDLSKDYYLLGNYDEAVRQGKEALRIRKKVLGTEHPAYMMTINDLAVYYSQLGNYEEAVRLEKELLDIVKKTIGKEQRGYAAVLSTLATYYSYLGNYEEAIRLGTEALDVIKRLLGTEHPDYASLLANLASYYSHLGKYEEAIRLGTEATEIQKGLLGLDHPNYAVSLGSLALYYSHSGNYEEAIRLGTEAMEITKRVLGTEHPNYATSLDNLAVNYSRLGNYEEAIRLGTEALEIRKRLYGLEHPEYALSLGNLATNYSRSGNYEEALRLGTEALEIRKKVLGTEHTDFALSLGEIATYYKHLGNYEETMRLGTQALEIIKKVLRTDNTLYATLLGNLAGYYSDLGNYREAIRIETEVMEITKKVLGTGHPNYAIALGNLAGDYSHLGNYEEAIRLGTEALEITKKVLGTEHPDYATTLGNLAGIYSHLGNYKEAIQLGTEALEIRKRILGIEHSEYASSLNNLATYYSHLGNYEEAIRLGTEALEIRKKVLGTDHPDYATTLGNLAGYYSALGNYMEAIRLGSEAMEIKKRILGPEHPDYASSLNELVNIYSDLGDYGEAIRLGIEAMEIRKRILGLEHPDYASSLGILAGCYSNLGDYGEAIRFGTEAMEIRKRILGSEHPDYALSLNDLAIYYSDLGNYEEAMRLGTEATEFRKKFWGNEHPYYALSLENLAVHYSHLGSYKEAIRLSTEALNIRKKVLGTEHPDYALSLSNLAVLYFYLGNYIEAYQSFNNSIEAFHAYMLRIFAEQSSHLRETFWGKYEYIYTKALPSYVYKYNTSESIAELYDKTCLFAKGLLLNSDIELRRLILESEDSILIAKYKTLSTNISIYNKLIEKPINERFMNADSLNNVIQQQEMELARESKVYGDYTRNLTSTWKDVQNHLGTDDIAIEFIDFPILGTDSIMYAALTLKKDYESPHMVTLFEKKQLMGIPDSTYYTRTSTYDLIWEPLEEELENVKIIYFAPSGELHRIGIEYVPVSQTENISDKYSLHRVSSTRQLALIQDGTKGEQSILYGGINYDENTNATPHVSTSSVGGVRGANIIYRSNVDSLLLRSSYEYLEGTKREVDQIADQMKRHQIHYLYYSGADGSEESFKKLDGTKPKMMHIATHGFYLTEEEAKLSNFARPQMELMMGDNQRAGRPVEDKPMTRSGLLFSGCNHAIHHEPIPDGVEDGILTAQEISTLDLRGLDLVVLSACQTALGDIASGEGVFGLQRGFKKAGAKTILMSIDKVDDEATRILMVEFYNNLMSGKSKYQSLKDAQKYLREYDNRKYDNPKYWASFIMLDGLD